MKVFITGMCGFVGSALAEALLEFREEVSIFGVDNLQRPGSEMNRGASRSLGVRVIHGDIRAASDLESVPAADWVIDAAANPRPDLPARTFVHASETTIRPSGTRCLFYRVTKLVARAV